MDLSKAFKALSVGTCSMLPIAGARSIGRGYMQGSLAYAVNAFKPLVPPPKNTFELMLFVVGLAFCVIGVSYLTYRFVLRD